MEFGDILRELLENNELNQKMLADELHISPAAIGNYVRGNRAPDYQTLKKIADFFHVSTDYLLDHPSVRKRSRPSRPETAADLSFSERGAKRAVSGAGETADPLQLPPRKALFRPKRMTADKGVPRPAAPQKPPLRSKMRRLFVFCFFIRCF